MSEHKRNFAEVEDYDSSFEDDEDDTKKQRKTQKKQLAQESLSGPSSGGPSKAFSNHSAGIPAKSFFDCELSRADSYKNSYLNLNAFERHRKLINDYFLYYPGARKLLQRDASKDKTDNDIIKEHHRFIWNDGDDPDTWEKQLSKKYYDKLFKEYCICDLSCYKIGKYAMRWRTEQEVVNGKGQFICGARKCTISEGLRTWEVNFAYMEDSVKKNALVKLRLCKGCSVKLNYHQKKKEVVKVPSSSNKKKKKSSSKYTDLKNDPGSSKQDINVKKEPLEIEDAKRMDENIWKEPVQLADVKTREEEFDDYLDDLFL